MAQMMAIGAELNQTPQSLQRNKNDYFKASPEASRFNAA